MLRWLSDAEPSQPEVVLDCTLERLIGHHPTVAVSTIRALTSRTARAKIRPPRGFPGKCGIRFESAVS
jgi:hypothetical protein